MKMHLILLATPNPGCRRRLHVCKDAPARADTSNPDVTPGWCCVYRKIKCRHKERKRRISPHSRPGLPVGSYKQIYTHNPRPLSLPPAFQPPPKAASTAAAAFHAVYKLNHEYSIFSLWCKTMTGSRRGVGGGRRIPTHPLLHFDKFLMTRSFLGGNPGLEFRLSQE